MGLEPMTSSLPRKCSTAELRRLLFTINDLRIRTPSIVARNFVLSGRRGSNSRPIAWKAIALPTELLPLKMWGEKDSNLRSRSNGFTVHPI